MTRLLLPIVLLPLAGFLINGLVGNFIGRRLVSVVACALPAAAFVFAVLATRALLAGDAPLVQSVFTWAQFGDRAFEVAFYFDRLTAVMALIVTGVGTLIHIYSTGYMHDDESYARYFAYLNLFLFFMLLLVLGRSLLVLFVGWEGVGLASYLLIGFWFDDPEKAAAGKKAFITNRVGDAGFLLGMFLLYHALGTLQMDAINAAFLAGPVAVSAGLVAVCLFIGATGKSAQIPLHVWLPDAMAGPTPVSALIHAATMVTAGVYLVARLHGIFINAPGASALIAVVGVATAFLAATVALVQTDIKKVLAYSTISQLGLMFLAAGVGAYGVAVFHLVTHAFFKACLFLGAGSVIHAMSGEQDIRRMGGLAKKIPITFVTFAVATAAIAGIPPLAGFFSKDQILWFALASERGGSPWLLVAGAATALMTAFYMFRLLWLTFFGTPRMDHEAAHHVHESPVSMTGVLAVLAVLSAVGGFFAVPHFLDGLLPIPGVRPELAHFEHALLVASVAIALSGLAAAAWFYAHDGARAARWRPTFEPVHRLLSGKYFVDELYQALFARPIAWVSDRVFLRLGDRWLIDGSLDGMAAGTREAAGLLARVQNGNLHRYAFLVLAGLVAVLLWSLRHG
jgi:NADH-quinone oxidoreductase subunit L